MINMFLIIRRLQKTTWSFVVAGLLFAAQDLPAQSIHKFLREGDREYERSKYRESENAYRQAERNAPTEKKNDVLYNTGNAIYQQGQYERSEDYYKQTAEAATDPALRADALHNLGNAYLKQKKLPQAVDAYQNSLRLRPGDPETKANLQLAKKLLKQQQSEQNQGQQQQQQNAGSNSSNQQQNPDQNQQPQPEQSGQQEQSEQQEQPADSDNKMTPEQARRLLETAVSPADQKNARKYRELDPGKHQTRPQKDW